MAHLPGEPHIRTGDELRLPVKQARPARQAIAQGDVQKYRTG